MFIDWDRGIVGIALVSLLANLKFRSRLIAMGAMLGWVVAAAGQTWQSQEWRPLFVPSGVHVVALEKARDSSVCVGNLRELWVAAQSFAFDHGDRLPGSWAELTNGLAQPSAFYCPADRAHPPQSEWSQVNFGAISYEMTAAGALMSSPEAVFIRCVVHGNAVSTRGVSREARPYEGRIPWSGIPTPALVAAKEGAVSLGCMRNLRDIRFAAVSFAVDRQNILPASLRDFSETDLNAAALRCPADVLTAAPVDFSEQAIASSNYILDAGGANSGDGSLKLAHCRIHGHFVKVDGVVVAGADRYPPRLITGHPLSRTVSPGRSTTLEVLTGDAGLGPFRFQWRRQQPFDGAGEPFTNSVDIAWATNSTMTLTNAGPQDEGFYDVVVVDAAGGYQLSAMAFVRVEPVVHAAVDPGIVCLSNLRGIGLAAGLYASSHNEIVPGSLEALPAFLGWPLTLYCPADSQRPIAGGWMEVNFDDTSYRFSGGGLVEASTNIVAACRVHGFALQSDGTVSAEPPRFLIPRALNDAGLRISVVTAVNKVTVLESSTDLARWSAVATNAPGQTQFQWTNVNWNAAGPMFYRTRFQ